MEVGITVREEVGSQMGKVPVEERERNLEFYKRWRIDGEDIYQLLGEYGFGFSRAYALKKQIEKKYPEEIKKLEIAQN